MDAPLWLDVDFLIKLHALIIAETGGADGVRSVDLLASALDRPLNRFHYEGVDDLVELAATYAAAISGNHPFVDGNKRSAFMAIGQFLADNGLELHADPDDATRAMLSLASGGMDIASLTAWLRPLVKAES